MKQSCLTNTQEHENAHLFTRQLVYSLTCLLVYLFTRLLVYSLTRLLVNLSLVTYFRMKKSKKYTKLLSALCKLKYYPYICRLYNWLVNGISL
ncbi:MAG: hypothetical protein LBP83_06150 [Dysgonamonadaceae bacterium]|jgi:hypothetical protein|nr:hypothetical protein [Dysgonamonadaceae bacterium]